MLGKSVVRSRPCGPFGLVAALLVAVAGAPAQDVPKGELAKYSYNAGAGSVFPGTVRDVSVYVPKAYDPAKPACVYVNQDGVQYNAPAVFDELIAKGEMPVTIGVFVTPGRVPAVQPGALDRYNRSLEYDGLGDRYARFVLEEILPFVEGKTTSDGRPIRLSKDGNDRAIAGSSSGAIAAFTAAWERPDAFRRVFSAIGTYVGLRGGHAYPTLIRKTEPKPLRVFLEDGSGDLNIYGGDWWIANQAMERSLVFAGYEVEHSWGEGGHNARHATEVFPDAMRWLWKGWPEPIAVGKGSAPFQEVVLPGEGWTLVGEGYRFTEGAAANAQGDVYFNDIPTSTTYRIAADGTLSTWLEDANRPNGQAFAPDGRLVVVETGSARVVARGADGKSEVLAEGIKGNDLVVRHDGTVYVTEPQPAPNAKSKVWMIRPGQAAKVVDEGLTYANGVTLSPDQSLLYVADARSHWVWSYQVQPDGTLAHKQQFYHLHAPDTADDGGADGMKTDREGRLYVATRLGVQVCDQAGRVNVILPTPGGARVTNLAFGGPDHDVLVVTCGDKVYRRKVKTRGALHFAPPITPAPPRL
jgi:sugar lactone lactonase YvrE/enterochelin esterase-like enzyme